MRSLWAFMFALRHRNEDDRKSLKPASLGSSVSALAVIPQYCKRRAKDTLHRRRFHLAHALLCFQWDTKDKLPAISTSPCELVVVGIRLDTGEELIDSAERG
jgi:hypothetical protein